MSLRPWLSTSGVPGVYAYAVSSFGPPLLHTDTTRSSIRFQSQIDGSRRVVLSLIPGDSSAEQGLHFELYMTRYARLAKIAPDAVEELLPEDHQSWAYIKNGGPEWEGFEGFLRTNGDVDRLANPFRSAGLV